MATYGPTYLRQDGGAENQALHRAYHWREPLAPHSALYRHKHDKHSMTQQGKYSLESQTPSWTGTSPGPNLCSNQCSHKLNSPGTGPCQGQVSVPHTISHGRHTLQQSCWSTKLSKAVSVCEKTKYHHYLLAPFGCSTLSGAHLPVCAMSSSSSQATAFQASLSCCSTGVSVNKWFSLLVKIKENSLQNFFFFFPNHICIQLYVRSLLSFESFCCQMACSSFVSKQHVHISTWMTVTGILVRCLLRDVTCCDWWTEN